MQSWTPKDIEYFRKTYQLTRRALGELLGVTVNCIYQWERGLRKPNKTVEILLARIKEELESKAKGHDRKV